MSLRKRLRSELEAAPDDRSFGSGWIAGTIALALALAGLFMVLIERQPALLGVPELSAMRMPALIKPLMFATMIAAFALGCLSLALRKEKLLGTLSVALVLIASLWGAMPRVDDLTDGHSVYFGLDFFILNVAFGGLLFIPMERIFPHRRLRHWWTSCSARLLAAISLSLPEFMT